jgi:hypothetical protein
MHLATRFPGTCLGRYLAALALAAFALSFSSATHAAIYIYELPGGSRMITDRPLHNKHYKLVRTSQNVRGMGTLLGSRNTAQILADPAAYDDLIGRLARTHAVDAALVKAVMHAESGFNPHATSRKGASGLMQLMPATAARFGVRDIYDPKQNVRGGVRYLKYLLARFGNDHRLVVAAYNAGENAVKRHKGIPPYPETRAYVRKVLRLHSRYGGTDAARTGARASMPKTAALWDNTRRQRPTQSAFQ